MKTTRENVRPKPEEEIDNLKQAVIVACDVWDSVQTKIEVGMTEVGISKLIEEEISATGCSRAFETIVNVGTKSEFGHGAPTKAKLSYGDLLHVDFGVKYNGCCSDIARLIYFRRPGEKSAPLELLEAFNLVNEIITECCKLCQPGAIGYEIDALAREMLSDNGFPEFNHALGHRIGKEVHEEGTALAPLWDEFGDSPKIRLETDSIFCLEPSIILPGIGYVALEEEIIIKEKSAEFIGRRQKELLVK